MSHAGDPGISEYETQRSCAFCPRNTMYTAHTSMYSVNYSNSTSAYRSKGPTVKLLVTNVVENLFKFDKIIKVVC